MRVCIMYFLVILSLITFIECRMEPYVVGGQTGRIESFPHAVFISVQCHQKNTGETFYWICGGSVLNEMLALSAAHCMAGCNKGSKFSVYVGHSTKTLGAVSTIDSYMTHPNYNAQVTSSDLGILKLNSPFKLGDKVKRVALMKKPPYDEKAQVAGWGANAESNNGRGTPVSTTNELQYVDQYVQKSEGCRQIAYTMPEGTICASSGSANAYASNGDSGSALIVRGYIQIGLVSYRMQSYKSLVVYTDTGYFYDWIKSSSLQLYCSDK